MAECQVLCDTEYASACPRHTLYHKVLGILPPDAQSDALFACWMAECQVLCDTEYASGRRRSRASLRLCCVCLEDADYLQTSRMLGPAQCIAVVFTVADARIGTGCQQDAHDLRVTLPRSEMHRRHLGVPVTPTSAWVRAMLEQPFHA